MAGIFGVVNGRSPERMARTLERLAFYHQDTADGFLEPLVRDRIGLVVTDPPALHRPARSAAEPGMLLAVSGRIFEERLSDPSGVPSPHALLTKFRAEGVVSLEGLNGEYLIAVWEDEPQRLTIVNDRFGLKRLYYWASGCQFVFAPTLLGFTALSDFPRTIDELALADYLSVGHHLNGRTWFSALRLLLPASVLTFSGGQLSLRAYWQFRAIDPTPPHRRVEWTAAHLSALEAAVRRRLPTSEGPVGVWIDDSDASRTLAELIQRSNPEGTCAVSDRPRAEDEFDSKRRGWILQQAIADGCHPCHAAQLASVAQAVQDRQGTVSSGHLAGVLGVPLRHPGPTATRLDDRRPESVCGRIFPEEEIRQILRPEIYRRVQGVVADTLSGLVAEAPGESQEEKTKAVLLRHHQQHETPCDLERFTTGCHVTVPFADRHVVEIGQVPVIDDSRPPSVHWGDYQEGHYGCDRHSSRCVHSFASSHPLLDLGDPLLGEFFRLSKFREFIDRHLEGDPVDHRKICLLAAITLWLGAIRTRRSGPGVARKLIHDSTPANSLSLR